MRSNLQHVETTDGPPEDADASAPGAAKTKRADTEPRQRERGSSTTAVGEAQPLATTEQVHAIGVPPKGDAPVAISDAFADQLAASYRPSWEPREAPTPASGQPSVHPEKANRVGADVTNLSTPAAGELDHVAVPGLLRQRRRAALLTLAAVAGFGLLATLAVLSGRPRQAPIPKPISQPEAPYVTAQEPPNAAPPELPAQQPAPAVASETARAAEPPTTPPPVAHAPVVDEPVKTVAAAQPSAPTSVQEPARKHLWITTSPESAEVLVDGTLVENPFDAALVKGTEHRVQARAPGHIEHDVTVTMDRDRRLALRLDKVPAEKPKRVASVSRPHRAPSARPAAIPRPSARPTQPPSASTAHRTKGAGFVSDSPY